MSDAEFWQTLPLGRNVTLLHHDPNGLAAFDKAAGVMSHPNTPADELRSLIVARYDPEGECYQWRPAGGEPRRLWLLNRLDSATSGVILAAASAELAAEIRAHFKRKLVRKVYHAVVFGAPSRPLELWRDRLAIEKRGGQIRTAAQAGNVLAECRMTALRVGRQSPQLSLLKLEPRTGRSHQLRVQCANRGLPIVGDQTYGDFGANRVFAKAAGTKRMFLHSSETSFDYDWRGQQQHFSARAPLPELFERYL